VEKKKTTDIDTTVFGSADKKAEFQKEKVGSS